MAPRAFFEAQKTLQPIFNGGKLWFSPDVGFAISTWDDSLIVTSLTRGTRVGSIKGDSSDLATFAVVSESISEYRLVIACKSLSLLFLSLSLDPSTFEFTLNRTVTRAHDAPILVATAHQTGFFATGSADGIVKVWSSTQGHCTHIFKGHGGPLSALCLDFRQTEMETRALLYSSAADCKVRVWDLQTNTCVQVIDSHSSVPTCLDVSEDGNCMISGGRDEVVLLWEIMPGNSHKLSQTILAYEPIESCGFVTLSTEEGGQKYSIYTAGHLGKLRFWDPETGKKLWESDKEVGRSHPILQVLLNHNEEIITIHEDHNIIFRRLCLPYLPVTLQIAGFNDEVVDLVLLSPSGPLVETLESHLAVATNSDLIRVYETSQNQSCFLKGHTDVVLALGASSDQNLLFSASKDKTVRVWSYETTTGKWNCVGIGEGHLESVGAVTAPHSHNAFFVSASQDLTCKVWDISRVKNEQHLPSLFTSKVHDKEVNAINMSPNDQFLGTASQDKTAKIFRVDFKLATKSEPTFVRTELLGQLKGHKRGVWSIKFSADSRQIATSSSDRTVRLWNVSDFSCLKIFEGHTNSVLKVDWFSATQLISCASDGLVKVWSAKDETCISTLDNHYDKIWCVTVSRDGKTVISAGADSLINFWIDVTKEKQEEEVAARDLEVLKEQEFSNFIATKDYKNAIILALEANHGPRLLRLFSRIWKDVQLESLTGPSEVDEVVASLSPEMLSRLLQFMRDWNTNAKTASIAQVVLHALLRSHPLQGLRDILASKSHDPHLALNGDATLEVLNSVVPYTERHYARLERMLSESYALEYALSLQA